MECSFLKPVHIMDKIYIKHFLQWPRKLNPEYLILIALKKKPKMELILAKKIPMEENKEAKAVVEYKLFNTILFSVYFSLLLFHLILTYK